MDLVNGSGPVGDPFRACHACTVGAAVEVAVRLNAMADHLHAAILAVGREGMYRALETVESVRVSTGHTYLKGLEFSTPPTNALTLTVVVMKRRVYRQVDTKPELMVLAERQRWGHRG